MQIRTVTLVLDVAYPVGPIIKASMGVLTFFTFSKNDVVALLHMSYNILVLNIRAFARNVQIAQEILHVAIEWGRSSFLMAFRASVFSFLEDRIEAILVENCLTLITSYSLIMFSNLVAKGALEALS